MPNHHGSFILLKASDRCDITLEGTCLGMTKWERSSFPFTFWVCITTKITLSRRVISTRLRNFKNSLIIYWTLNSYSIMKQDKVRVLNWKNSSITKSLTKRSSIVSKVLIEDRGLPLCIYITTESVLKPPRAWISLHKIIFTTRTQLLHPFLNS